MQSVADLRAIQGQSFHQVCTPALQEEFLTGFNAVVVDENTVVVAGFDRVMITKDGQQLSFPGRVTFVVGKKSGNDWKFFHLYRSKMPS